MEHEKLVAYARALELAALLETIAQGIPIQRADLQDQLRRASASIPLNIAEGAGEFSPSEKARFHRIARRSAAECGAILDLHERMTATHADLSDARTRLTEMGSMLTAMVKAVEDRRR